MGKHRDRMLAMQQSEEWADSRRGRHEVKKAARETAMESRHYYYHRHPQHAGKLAGLSLLESGARCRSSRYLTRNRRAVVNSRSVRDGSLREVFQASAQSHSSRSNPLQYSDGLIKGEMECGFVKSLLHDGGPFSDTEPFD